MRNAGATYILTEATDRTILSVTTTLEAAVFAQRNVLDIRISSVPTSRWMKELAPKLVKDDFNRLVNLQSVEPAADPPSDITKDKWRRSTLLTEGYHYLLWYANLATEQYWATSSLDYDDMAMYVMDRESYIQVYADAKKIDYADAQKQLEFDMDNLRANALRRKQILWTYERELAAITNATQLQLFKDNVKRGTVEIGFV